MHQQLYQKVSQRIQNKRQRRHERKQYIQSLLTATNDEDEKADEEILQEQEQSNLADVHPELSDVENLFLVDEYHDEDDEESQFLTTL
ncbi:unnamed protein product [Didymodactylos carnosus]|uniref:Uncharacterized protein n=2 Tax=Didymodactylos carnosus TaxID=1234261 RepID=A0A815L039_9BILA|nr:unnamed protein product [Didymodactylos carnosus]CAF4294173.1 unnamed protein product [Didymodactylos carnosus]